MNMIGQETEMIYLPVSGPRLRYVFVFVFVFVFVHICIYVCICICILRWTWSDRRRRWYIYQSVAPVSDMYGNVFNRRAWNAQFSQSNGPLWIHTTNNWDTNILKNPNIKNAITKKYLSNIKYSMGPVKICEPLLFGGGGKSFHSRQMIILCI